MKELTDLEICTRIAEIEGFPFEVKSLSCVTPKGVWPKVPFNSIGMSLGGSSYDPLTDDALCFQLIIKHEVEVLPLVTGVNCKHSAVVRAFNGCDDFIEFKEQSDTLNKAICLAIIKAHG